MIGKNPCERFTNHGPRTASAGVQRAYRNDGGVLCDTHGIASRNSGNVRAMAIIIRATKI